jgi:DNA polymerase III epsilon subunit family exonuclease
MAHPSPGSELKNLVFVGFDTETTGLSPLASHLVELSGVKFQGNGSVISTFSQLIDPESQIPAEATAVHGITSKMVKGQPTYREAVPAFLEWLGNDVVLVAHNASFDLGFLEVAMARLRLPSPTHPVIDTLHLCRRLLPGAPNHQLKTLTEHLGLNAGGYHRALADSYHVKDLLVRVLPLIPERQTWKEFSQTGSVLEFTDLCIEQFDRTDVMPAGFESLKEAIHAKSTLRLVYNNGQTSNRTVTPHSVHNWKGHMYLAAFCHTSQAERTFRLDKIVSFGLQDR